VIQGMPIPYVDRDISEAVLFCERRRPLRHRPALRVDAGGYLRSSHVGV